MFIYPVGNELAVVKFTPTFGSICADCQNCLDTHPIQVEVLIESVINYADKIVIKCSVCKNRIEIIPPDQHDVAFVP
jgi:hypothetical protein